MMCDTGVSSAWQGNHPAGERETAFQRPTCRSYRPGMLPAQVHAGVTDGVARRPPCLPLYVGGISIRRRLTSSPPGRPTRLPIVCGAMAISSRRVRWFGSGRVSPYSHRVTSWESRPKLWLITRIWLCANLGAAEPPGFAAPVAVLRRVPFLQGTSSSDCCFCPLRSAKRPTSLHQD